MLSQERKSVGAVAAAIGVLLLVGCKGKNPVEAPPPAVMAAEVKQMDVPIYHEWIGTLNGFVDAHIRAQVSGYLLKQNYKEGAFVKAGDLLFEIDPRPFKAAVEVAEGQLAQAEAQLAKTQWDVERYKPLADKSAISKQELDDAIQANRAAMASVKSAKATVDEAKLNLEFTKITSHIDGIAGIATAQIGDLVGPTTGDLTTVSTVDPIKDYFTITEQSYIAYYKKFFTETSANPQADEMQLELILADGTVYPHKGKLYAVDREVNPRTGTVRVAGLFANPGNILRPGQFSRVRVTFQVKRGALLIPQRALNEFQGSYQVAVVEADDTIDIRTVTVGEKVGTLCVIDEGLKPGETVVAEGVEKVKQGMTVTVKSYNSHTSRGGR